jgi:inner membrane transporter RhtA
VAHDSNAPVGPALLVVGAATVQEVGAAFAVGLFAYLGAAGATFSRLAVSGIILWVVVRPQVRGLTRRAWLVAIGLGCALGAMNLCFYEALSRIPLGITVTIEVLGPLLLSVALSRRRIAWLWALLAFAGVAAIGLAPGWEAHVNGLGVAFAAGAALSWAGYIVATSRAARLFPRLDALAIATTVGALLTAPFAVFTIDGGAALHVAAIALVVALMSSVIPYSLELWSLRTLAPRTFAVLTCSSPVIAVLAGWIVLGQQLGWIACAAIVLVTGASVGAVRSARGSDRLPPV